MSEKPLLKLLEDGSYFSVDDPLKIKEEEEEEEILHSRERCLSQRQAANNLAELPVLLFVHRA
jgi:hypothetical protein